MSKTFFHVDLDAFFAAVEQLDNPALQGTPVIVGADPGGRGVVAACSYEARKHGVHSAMPISMARQRCPHATFLPVRMSRYQEISQGIMQYLRDKAPVMHQVSIDEAFLDYSGTRRLLGEPAVVASRLRQETKARFGLTMSIGIGVNAYIAKLASAAAKPDGILEVAEADGIDFVDSIPLGKLWGIGPKTLEQLQQFNICSTTQLRRATIADLTALFGPAGAQRLHAIVRGIDPGIIQDIPHSRSISTEHTFERDERSPARLRTKLFELCHSVMFRSLHEGFVSATVVVRVRSAQFETRSSRRTLPHPVYSSQELYETAWKLMQPLAAAAGSVRLIGVGLGNLSDSSNGSQQDLFPEKKSRQSSVESAILQLQRKYGRNAVTKADLIPGETDRPGDQPGND
ncbi:DNA polymerase IV [Spirochaeta africana]|uniref:DNA polymerase IV n=1 Tax=Spirochaeta africana (strain ATCC 700263 / DSM 8902 / Z-7692) TaxID=889378 RepID=H9UJT2_SPIAZ|nr:DNA polymerase IV [Spirochaeta africana]AFG37775.1 nucleotidyltransferase/DNA polymerase involved in DNA repair [Spirochaeta africana DSM 8902]